MGYERCEDKGMEMEMEIDVAKRGKIQYPPFPLDVARCGYVGMKELSFVLFFCCLAACTDASNGQSPLLFCPLSLQSLPHRYGHMGAAGNGNKRRGLN